MSRIAGRLASNRRQNYEEGQRTKKAARQRGSGKGKICDLHVFNFKRIRPSIKSRNHTGRRKRREY